MVSNLGKYERAFYAATRARDGYGPMQVAVKALEDGFQDTEIDFGPNARRILGEPALETYRGTGSWENTELLRHISSAAGEFKKGIEDSTCKDICNWAGINIPEEGQAKIRGYGDHKLKKVRTRLLGHQNREAFDEDHREAYTLGYEDAKMFSTLDSLARAAQRKRFRGSNGIHSQVVRQHTEDAIKELYRDPHAISA